MKPMRSLLILLCLAGVSLANDPDRAKTEAERRGNYVEVIGRGYEGEADLFAEAMQPPADDSHKWHLSIVTQEGCAPCTKLLADMAAHDCLKAFVDQKTPANSWAHYQIYRIEDQTQQWRWKDIQFAGFPTILIQPPRNGQFGGPETVVDQITGYDGNPRALASKLRGSVYKYVKTIRPNERLLARATEERGFEPPFTPPAKPQDAPPFYLPPAPAPSISLDGGISLLTGILTGIVPGGMNTLTIAALGIGLWLLIRDKRKQAGKKIVVPDEIADPLKKLVDEYLATKKPGPSASG